MQEEGLIYDWNAQDGRASRPVSFCDETLCDGLQSPSVRTPPAEEKLRILRLMESMGIDCANIGLPGAGAHVVSEVSRLASEIVSQNPQYRLLAGKAREQSRGTIDLADFRKSSVFGSHPDRAGA